MAQDREELLPCPFCGGAASIKSSGSATAIWCANDQCVIGTDIPIPFNDWGHKTDAIAAWNRRPTPPAHGDVRERAKLAEQCWYRLGYDRHGGPWSDESGEDASPARQTAFAWADWIISLAARTGEPVACQKCAGKIEGWTCQSCGQDFSESPDGKLVFAHPVPEQDGWRVGDFAERLEDHPLVKTGEVHEVIELFSGGYLGFRKPVGGEWNPRGWRKVAPPLPQQEAV